MTTPLRSLPLVRALALLLATGSLLTLAPMAAHAAKFYQGKQLVIAEADTIHDDVYVQGGNVTIRGVVDGDVVACGGKLYLDGTVLGDVLACGGQLSIDGDVKGSVRAAGGKVRVSANVTRDLVVGAGNIEVLPEAKIGRDAMLGGGRTDMDGHIARNVKVAAQQFVLGEGSAIGGDLDYASDRSLMRAQSATVGGKITWHASDWNTHRPTMSERIFRKMWHAGRFTVGLLIVGLLFVLIFPTVAQRSLEGLATQPLPSAATGLLVAILLPAVAGALLIIGLLLGGWWAGAFLMALWGIGLVLGSVVAATAVGRWLGSIMGARGLAMGWALVLGAFVLMIVKLIPIIGWLAIFFATIGGLGALSRLAGRAIAASRAKPAVG